MASILKRRETRACFSMTLNRGVGPPLVENFYFRMKSTYTHGIGAALSVWNNVYSLGHRGELDLPTS